MEEIDVVVVGAGVVGLACAAALAERGREVYVFEKNPSFGQETSSRKSEVIHAGLYYPKDWLKTKLCCEGREMLYELAAKYDIPHRKIGKLLIATREEERSTLEEKAKQAEENGVPVRFLDASDVKALEPEISCRSALYSPETGIISAHELMQHFVGRLTSFSSAKPLFYNTEVVAITPLASRYELTFREKNGDLSSVMVRNVINAAGLHADTIAEIVGVSWHESPKSWIEKIGYRQHFWKGDYFRIHPRHRGKVQHLVYPLPEKGGLGIHLTLELDGSMKLGPDATYLPEKYFDYTVDEGKKELFFQAVQRYLPFLSLEDISPDQSGIRPRLYKPGEPVRDFIIQEESARGLPGFVNLLGIESPGLTAAPAIGEYVAGVVEEN
ncbi:NAD(P)/FAD-dependent oxidoreductase [Candidatus Woesearchaeota archaeon]|nr:NAD(P)/FAD-dependent oxidoreductase [Candidatus Woesearchaeota archaeon]